MYVLMRKKRLARSLANAISICSLYINWPKGQQTNLQIDFLSSVWNEYDTHEDD